MAAATTILAGVGAATGLVGGISKMIGGGKRKRQMKREIRQFEKTRQKFENVHEGRRISTRGADAALQEMQRGAATSLDTLASGGIRGVVGGVGAVQGANVAGAQQVGRNLDEQEVQLSRDYAQDEGRIQQMTENREQRQEDRLYASLNAAQQDQMSGLGDITGAAFGAAGALNNASIAKGIGAGAAPSSLGAMDFSKMGQTQRAFQGASMAMGNVPPAMYDLLLQQQQAKEGN